MMTEICARNDISGFFFNHFLNDYTTSRRKNPKTCVFLKLLEIYASNTDVIF